MAGCATSSGSWSSRRAERARAARSVRPGRLDDRLRRAVRVLRRRLADDDGDAHHGAALEAAAAEPARAFVLDTRDDPLGDLVVVLEADEDLVEDDVVDDLD